jgi:hypothetical protein
MISKGLVSNEGSKLSKTPLFFATRPVRSLSFDKDQRGSAPLAATN